MSNDKISMVSIHNMYQLNINQSNVNNPNLLFDQRSKRSFVDSLTSIARIKEFLSHYNNTLNVRIHCSRKRIGTKLKSLKLDKYKKKKIKSFFMCGTFAEIEHDNKSDHSNRQRPLNNESVLLKHNDDNPMNSNDIIVCGGQQTSNCYSQCGKQSNEVIAMNCVCDLCLKQMCLQEFLKWSPCGHSICKLCAISYIYEHIMVNFNYKIPCHQCSCLLGTNQIRHVLYSKPLDNLQLSTGQIIQTTSKQLYDTYETMCLERALFLIPNLMHCPGKNCTYAVIADNCEDCPKIKCHNKNCGIYFCYYCKSKWHPDKNCTDAMMHHLMKSMKLWSTKKLSKLYQLHLKTLANFSEAVNSTTLVDKFGNINENNNYTEEIRLCPTCKCVVVKENDGKCNLVNCNICQTQFCWLCMQPKSDTHYMLPSGCTYFGKKRWTNEQTLCWRIALMPTSPLWIPCVCALLIPICVLVLPIYAATILHHKLKKTQSSRVSTLGATCGFFMTTLCSPLIYASILVLGLPVTLYYTFFKLSKAIWKDRRRFKDDHNNYTIRYKLSLSYIQEQLFLLHIQWALTQLAETHSQMTKLPVNDMQRLLSKFFNDSITTVQASTKSRSRTVGKHSLSSQTDNVSLKNLRLHAMTSSRSRFHTANLTHSQSLLEFDLCESGIKGGGRYSTI